MAMSQQVVNDFASVDGKSSGLTVVRLVSAPMRTWLLHYGNEAIPQQVMLRAIRGHQAVAIAQNNHVVKDRAVPDDAQYGQQWHHQNIASEAAWDITTGGVTATGDTIVVCIIENADLPHPDLVDNAWYNIHEVVGNGVDDDGNGYVDDVRGWSPQNNNDNVYGGGHGTQVAGMIGAKGNNGTSVAGANWDVKMMVVTRQGVSEAAVVASYTYPLVMRRAYNASNGALGAFVVATNASWGIDNGQPEDSPIWCAMYDTLGAAGVLNCGATANNNVDVDVVGDLPTACASDFMMSVTATNIDDDSHVLRLRPYHHRRGCARRRRLHHLHWWRHRQHQRHLLRQPANGRRHRPPVQRSMQQPDGTGAGRPHARCAVCATGVVQWC